MFSQSAASLQTDAGGNLVSITTKTGETMPCDLLIGATGFAGCRADVCEAFGVERDRTVKTEKGRFQTNVPHIFTAGDMHRGQSLVVHAIAEGRACAAEGQSLVVHAIAEGRACAAEVDEFLMGYTNLR